MHISESYMNKSFDSCKSVMMPSTQQPAISLMCGQSSSSCTPKKWFEFMGTPSINPFVPFLIHYNISTNLMPSQKILNPKTIPCSQQIDVIII